MKDRPAIKAYIYVNRLRTQLIAFSILPHEVSVPFRIMQEDLNYFQVTSVTLESLKIVVSVLR